MPFRPKNKDMARRDSVSTWELQQIRDLLEPHCLDKPIQKEMSLFSRKNYSYVDNRKITIISNSVIFIRL